MNGTQFGGVVDPRRAGNAGNRLGQHDLTGGPRPTCPALGAAGGAAAEDFFGYTATGGLGLPSR